MELNDGTYTTEALDESKHLYRMTDRDGNKMTYRFYGGHRYVEAFAENCSEMLESIASMECREDDVILATYPKSGLHWITNVVGMVVSGTTEYTGSPRFIEFVKDIAQFKDLKSPRVMGTHISYDLLPREIIQEKKGRIISISRNPKDVAVSLYTYLRNLPIKNPYEGTFDGFLKYFLREEMICDGWFQHYKGFQIASKQLFKKPILFLRYEDMKSDLLGQIKKISNFLGHQYSEDFLKEIEQKCSFGSMKTGALKRSEEFEVVLPVYRKGDIGDWKNWFTVAQNELFDAVYLEKMSGFDANFRFT